MTQTSSKQEQLNRLVSSFHTQIQHYKQSTYKESQLRNDYLNPLLKIFGWDVDNKSGKSQYLRDVLQEEELEIEEADRVTIKNPDYTLQVFGERKLFIEAKKVAIDIETHPISAFQVRRYGWNGQLNLSVLTNFEKLIFYDCRVKPVSGDNSSICRYKIYTYTEYVDKFDEISSLLGYESVAGGSLDTVFASDEPSGVPFDEYFLIQINKWRQLLAQDIFVSNKELKEDDINFQVQRLINRIVFLRICEDRNIEKYETLQHITDYEELKKLFLKADQKYNSGLFDFIEDELSLSIKLNSLILIAIFNELYYPQSPFNFSVVDPEILSQIYERFLGSKIVITSTAGVSIVQNAEVAASDGVVPTPKQIVHMIVKNTLTPLTEGKGFNEIINLKVADISCGSGTFLLAGYDFLIEEITKVITNEHIASGLAREHVGGSKTLTLAGKKLLVTQCLFGTDINPYAVEVTRFSLSLKIIEGENNASVKEHNLYLKEPILPNLDSNVLCANSLVGPEFLMYNPDVRSNFELLFRIRPFDWLDGFPFLRQTQGFDAIVGNPPFVRIQNMVHYASEEVDYYQSGLSPYASVIRGTFDKYYLFIVRALTLVNPKGRVGYIVPNKFFTLKGADLLRKYISEHSFLTKIIHFGSTQVFPGRLTYTAILILSKLTQTHFAFSKVSNLKFVKNLAESEHPTGDFYSDPWLFIAPETQRIFEKAYQANTIPLKDISKIAVGLQTSADKIYIFRPIQETENEFVFKDKYGNVRRIEKAICLPCLLDLPFENFETITANARIIYPYQKVAGKATLIDEQTLQTQFPLAGLIFLTLKMN